jgi:8-oxo-dGTP diphosphatase
VDRVRAGVVIVEDGRLAVIERHREDRHYFTLPGGGVDAGETVERAAVREALEELGVEVELLGPIGLVVFHRRDRVTHQHYFGARIVGGTFGSGTGPEYQPGLDPGLGTYHPTWLALAETAELVVHPHELIAAVRSQGLHALMASPVELFEVVEG